MSNLSVWRPVTIFHFAFSRNLENLLSYKTRNSSKSLNSLQPDRNRFNKTFRLSKNSKRKNAPTYPPMGWLISYKLYVISTAWTVQKNLRFFSKLNQNTVWWFQASFGRILEVLVTCEFEKNPKKSQKKIVKHHQITSAPETFQKLAWIYLTTSWFW